LSFLLVLVLVLENGKIEDEDENEDENEDESPPLRLHFTVHAVENNLFCGRLPIGGPVHGAGNGGPHLVEPPLAACDACFAPPAVDAGLRAVESEFELLVGCHNINFNYDTTLAEEVGQRLSK
jgi:hypothetical protein